ncbi:tetratricopeptide repeat protein [Candidatus Uabimicrobium sp. HlEnr_7]|uniref:tetratricopeptide repeat protein n=1 Tax=Candidatus Uabimicrobium helgolandensis TaxID=3095367 RepID=UPI0035578B59
MLTRILITLVLITLNSCSFKQAYPNEIIPAGEPSVSMQAHFLAGLQEEYSMNWGKALKHFEKVIAMDARTPRPHIHLARCLLFMQNIHDGIYHLEQAEKLATKDDYMLWFDIGSLYHILRMKDNARICYEKSITIYPLFQKAAFALNELDKI